MILVVRGEVLVEAGRSPRAPGFLDRADDALVRRRGSGRPLPNRGGALRRASLGGGALRGRLLGGALLGGGTTCGRLLGGACGALPWSGALGGALLGGALLGGGARAVLFLAVTRFAVLFLAVVRCSSLGWCAWPCSSWRCSSWPCSSWWWGDVRWSSLLPWRFPFWPDQSFGTREKGAHRSGLPLRGTARRASAHGPTSRSVLVRPSRARPRGRRGRRCRSTSAPRGPSGSREPTLRQPASRRRRPCACPRS